VPTCCIHQGAVLLPPMREESSHKVETNNVETNMLTSGPMIEGECEAHTHRCVHTS